MARAVIRMTCVIVLGMVLVGTGASLASAAAPDTVDLVEVTGVIDPPTAEYVRTRLETAERDGVHAIVLQLDTPGGLDVSMREIVGDILDAEVPVVVWVAPRGARAASAGTFVAYAAHAVFMAEATELGAATPINLGGETSPTLQEKVTNDSVAFIRELAVERGRNGDWAEDAVRDAASIGATEAVEIGVADGIASSPAELLQGVDGKEVTLASGREVVLETWDEAVAAPTVRYRIHQMNLLQRLLHALVSPEVALFLLLIGVYGLIFELYNPGIGLAGILGAVALVMAFYGLNVLPTNWVGVFLVVLGVVFFLVDLHVAGLGVWTAGGLVSLIAGSLFLFAGAPDALTLSPFAILGAVATTLIFFVSVMTAALRVRLRRPVTGEDAVVGLMGEARTDIAPEGTVFTKGTLWRARTMETGIAAGSKVKVKATEGLVLLVEPAHDDDEPTDPMSEASAGR